MLAGVIRIEGKRYIPCGRVACGRAEVREGGAGRSAGGVRANVKGARAWRVGTAKFSSAMAESSCDAAGLGSVGQSAGFRADGMFHVSELKSPALRSAVS